MSDTFPIENGLKQDDLSLLPFSLVSEYSIRKIQENKVRLELNGTHHLLACHDGVNLLGENINLKNKYKLYQMLVRTGLI